MEYKSFMFLVAVCLIAGLDKATPISLGGCSDDSTCTDLCGYAGKGKCIDNSHCMCETCPQRSTAELSLAYSLKVCTPEPFCQLKCPSSSFKHLYSGHVCASPGSLPSVTCICFCMPLTIESLGTVLRCPVLPNNTITSSITSFIG